MTAQRSLTTTLQKIMQRFHQIQEIRRKTPLDVATIDNKYICTIHIIKMYYEHSN